MKVDKQCRTNDPSLFAIGDVTPGPQLAHKANHQGIVAAEVAAGREAAFEPRAIPFVEYTDPELAECGLSEEQAKSQGIPYKVARFPWQASGRATTLGENTGMTKFVIDPDSERVLGVGIVGPNAGELISEAALAVEMGATTTDIAMTIHPHPTLSETIMEAAARSLGRSIHIGPSRQIDRVWNSVYSADASRQSPAHALTSNLPSHTESLWILLVTSRLPTTAGSTSVSHVATAAIRLPRQSPSRMGSMRKNLP